MMSDRQIEELFTCDYDMLVDNLLREMASISMDKNLIDDIIDVSSEPIRSDLLEVISRIRDEKIISILKGKNEER